MSAEDRVETVASCPRCGQRHEGVSFAPLTNPITTSAFESLTHFALCPDNGQPIMLARQDIEFLHVAHVGR
jgi:hypothetical protein